MPCPSPRLARPGRREEKGSRGGGAHTARLSVRALARGPLIVSRTSARRIDLSHGKRQIAARRSLASLGSPTRQRAREREGGGEEEGEGIPAREQIRSAAKRAPTCLSTSFRLAGLLGRPHVNGTNAARVRRAADKGLAACTSLLSLRFLLPRETGNRSRERLARERS